MKRSIWQCRISPSTKFSSYLRPGPLFSTSLLAVLIAASCQLSQRAEIDASQPVGRDLEAPLALRPPLAPPPTALNSDVERRVLLRGPGPTHPALAELAASSCANELTELQITTTLVTAFGPYPVHFSLRGLGNGETVRADVEGFRASFAVSTPVKAKLLGKLCSAAQAGRTDVEAEPAQVDQLRDFLEVTSPDCEKVLPGSVAQVLTSEGAAAFEPNWRCYLPITSSDEARQELAGIQTTMIRRWSRQPYLLARRLAVGATLAQVLEAKDQEKALNTFCKMVHGSLPVELPAALASKRWQSAACDKPTPERLEVARFGLAKTVAEIDFMRELFERTSRLGFLSLRVPQQQTGGRDILVSLKPSTDVADNLAHETTRIWLQESGGDAMDLKASLDDMPRACWHPVFAEDQGLLRLARQLGMAGEAARVVCEDQTVGKDVAFQPERYVAESVASETEFVITNGRSKTLRLPIGKYSYTLRVLPENPEEWDDAAATGPKVTGEITWEAKRPRAVIATW